MNRLSKIRYRLFAHKLTSSISDNSMDLTRVDILLTQSRLGYETMLSTTAGERIDQRRSASTWQLVYRQSITAPAALVLVLDISCNRAFHKTILYQINQIINYAITSCEQLWLECIILYPNDWQTKEYICEWLEATIKHLTKILKNATINCELSTINYELLHNEYHNHHVIIISDRLSWDDQHDGDQIQTMIYNGQVLWYIRDYPSPILHRGNIPEWLIWLKL